MDTDNFILESSSYIQETRTAFKCFLVNLYVWNNAIKLHELQCVLKILMAIALIYSMKRNTDWKRPGSVWLLLFPQIIISWGSSLWFGFNFRLGILTLEPSPRLFPSCLVSIDDIGLNKLKDRPTCRICVIDTNYSPPLYWTYHLKF